MRQRPDMMAQHQYGRQAVLAGPGPPQPLRAQVSQADQYGGLAAIPPAGEECWGFGAAPRRAHAGPGLRNAAFWGCGGGSSRAAVRRRGGG
jgi:hypothetical protein